MDWRLFEIDGSFRHLVEFVKVETKSTVSLSEVSISDESRIDKKGVVSVESAERENRSQSKVVPGDMEITATAGIKRRVLWSSKA